MLSISVGAAFEHTESTKYFFLSGQPNEAARADSCMVEQEQHQCIVPAEIFLSSTRDHRNLDNLFLFRFFLAVEQIKLLLALEGRAIADGLPTDVLPFLATHLKGILFTMVPIS